MILLTYLRLANFLSASLASTAIDHAFLIATLFLLDYFLWLGEHRQGSTSLLRRLYLRVILSGLPQLCDSLQFLARVCWLARVVCSVVSSVKSTTQSNATANVCKRSQFKKVSPPLARSTVISCEPSVFLPPVIAPNRITHASLPEKVQQTRLNPFVV